MAAIGRDIALRTSFAVCCLAVAAIPRSGFAADASSEAREQITAVAAALSSGDAAAAMSHFSKSLPDYTTVRRYFEGLSAFQVENQLKITDEEGSDKDFTLTITWDITLTDFGTDRSRRRSGDIHVKLAPVGSKWRIVEFTPVDIFNPQVQ
jgi:hypothetical protein